MNPYLSLKDHVYNHIREKINSGQLEENSRITEQQLADELGVSRTPVREAMLQLAGNGYLEFIPRRGFKLIKLSNSQVAQIYEVIGTLDGKAASLAIDYLTKKDLQDLKQLIREMDKAIETEQLLEYNQLQKKFHGVYIEKCGNKKLEETLRRLSRSLLNTTYSTTPSHKIKEVLTTTNNEHKELLNLLQLRDKVAVRKYLEEVHWRKENAQYDEW